jgi:TfoX/Sxy family transcriptional regulator of competence genes
MSWKKSPDWLVETFYQSLPSDELVERRKMFGYPCAFVNGNMFIGLHENNMVVRMPEHLRQEMIENNIGSQFKPFPEKVMKEYIALSEETLNNSHKLKELVLESFAYALSLKVKPKKIKNKS